MKWINVKSSVLYISRKEFDDHSQDEDGPEDVQSLEHEHQSIKKVERGEGWVPSQGQN